VEIVCTASVDEGNRVWRRCNGQADHVKKYHYQSIVTENTKYALRAANPRPAYPDPLTAFYLLSIQRLPNHGTHLDDLLLPGGVLEQVALEASPTVRQTIIINNITN
jgi:hypothetical protein